MASLEHLRIRDIESSDENSEDNSEELVAEVKFKGKYSPSMYQTNTIELGSINVD